MERSFNFLNQAELEFSLKERIYSLVTSGKSIPVKLAELKAMEIDKDLEGAMTEIISAF